MQVRHRQSWSKDNTHKTQKVDQESKCKIENEDKDHSKDNINDLSCSNETQNLNDVQQIFGDGGSKDYLFSRNEHKSFTNSLNFACFSSNIVCFSSMSESLSMRTFLRCWIFADLAFLFAHSLLVEPRAN